MKTRSGFPRDRPVVNALQLEELTPRLMKCRHLCKDENLMIKPNEYEYTITPQEMSFFFSITGDTDRLLWKSQIIVRKTPTATSN